MLASGAAGYELRMKQGARKIPGAQGVEVPADVQRGVSDLLRAVGEARAIEVTGVSRASLARLVAGLTVRKGTIALVRAGLATRAQGT